MINPGYSSGVADLFEDCDATDGFQILYYCEWAPHSPDLNPPDFYLWGYLKDNVHINNPQTIPDLKAVITPKIRQIPREECVRVIGNFARRLQVCLQRGGGHMEHILERQ
ncbi:transposable element tc3 transposase [Plakobranchus ocellatus]|uniref:Transposable element tc3 transposase n=1 Tax=Plakobranchus ocellatus TaxID=259542 RepID=A0AAV4CGW8_9GAST|nr:transposable element tc3 transposase [Plakobranchus ocellatus]